MLTWYMAQVPEQGEHGRKAEKWTGTAWEGPGMSYVGGLWGAVNNPATLLGSQQWGHRHEEANGNDRVSFTKEGCDHRSHGKART